MPDLVSRTPAIASPDSRAGVTPPPAGYPSLPDDVRAGVVQQLVEVIAVRHANLTEAQIRELTATLQVQVDNAETLHAYPLANHDEPILVVRAALGR